MNHKTLLCCLTFAFAGIISANAQGRQAGEIMASIGVGYSNLRDYSDFPAQITTELPELSATVDYYVIPEYSIGISANYENMQGTGSSYPYNGPNISYTETVTRMDFSIRSLVYFNKSDKPGFYGGVCLGYRYFSNEYNPASTSGNIPYYNNQPKYAPTIQAFLGVRANITNGFSTYFQLGTGTPYFAEMGFSFSFGGRPAPPPATPPAGQNAGGNAPYVR